MHSIMIYALVELRELVLWIVCIHNRLHGGDDMHVCMKNECELTGEASHHAVMLCIVFKLQLL